MVWQWFDETALEKMTSLQLFFILKTLNVVYVVCRESIWVWKGQTGLVRLGNPGDAACAAVSLLFLSPRCSRITSQRMKVSCKQRCNVVEQTPSRHGVAAHSCSLYQSKADREIYEGNKGGCWTRASDGCQRKWNIHYNIFKWTTWAAKVAGELRMSSKQQILNIRGTTEGKKTAGRMSDHSGGLSNSTTMTAHEKERSFSRQDPSHWLFSHTRCGKLWSHEV